MSVTNNIQLNRISVASFLSVALIYALLGGICFILSILPGYASPVFPAAGFAVAVLLCFGPRILPAIWFGALILNIAIVFSQGSLSIVNFIIAVVIASGAMLQALAGQQLVQYWLGNKWRSFESERIILYFLLIAGPLSCLISATVGISSLLSVGMIHISEWKYGWWNWFVGDTLGVLLLSPIIVGWLNRHEIAWSGRLKVIILPTIAMLIAVAVSFLTIANWDQENLKRNIEDQAHKVERNLGNHIVALQEILSSLAGFIEVTPDLTANQFNRFTQSILSSHPDIAALSFNPILSNDQRLEFEQNLKENYPPKAPQIMERDSQGILISAPLRDDYVVVKYIAPFQQNAQAIGFNIASEPIRFDAIRRSRLSGTQAITSKINLVQDHENKPGVLVLTPVKSRGNRRDTDTAQEPIQGFAVAVIKVDELIQIATDSLLPEGISLEIADPTAIKEKQLLYFSGDPGSAVSSYFSWQTSLTIADRNWTLKVLPDVTYIQHSRSIMAWIIGIVGILLISMLQVILLGVTGRNYLIQKRIDEQTIQLRRYATVFTHASEGIVITTPDSKIIDVNDAFTRITGYSREEVIGQNPRLLSSGQQDKGFFTSFWGKLEQSGKWHGEIWNRRKNGEIYVEMLSISEVRNDEGNLKNYIGIFSDITMLKNQQKQLEHIAHYDPLTSLPNRLLLEDRLHHAMVQTLRNGAGFVVAYIDLDGFKEVNDNYGHLVGDQVLKGVAQNMVTHLRAGDTLARIGGDEFIAVLLDLENIEMCFPMLERLLDAAEVPVQVGEQTHDVTASIGVTFYPQNVDVDSEQLLNQSDQAMYQAKVSGKNQYRVFEN